MSVRLLIVFITEFHTRISQGKSVYYRFCLSQCFSTFFVPRPTIMPQNFPTPHINTPNSKSKLRPLEIKNAHSETIFNLSMHVKIINHLTKVVYTTNMNVNGVSRYSKCFFYILDINPLVPWVWLYRFPRRFYLKIVMKLSSKVSPLHSNVSYSRCEIFVNRYRFSHVSIIFFYLISETNCRFCHPQIIVPVFKMKFPLIQ